MDIYQELDYKSAIKKRVKELHRLRPTVTLKRLAGQIPIQYTYLSKVLNDTNSHLSEDHLFTLCQLLEFFPDEVEFILTLRAFKSSQNPDRIHYLKGKLDRFLKTRNINASLQDCEVRQLGQEIRYLLDPMAVIVHVSLHIETFRQQPRRLCGVLGISSKRLDEILEKLNQLDFIEREQDSNRISEVKKGHIHYSTDHPLMRIHQEVMRTLSGAQLLKNSEPDKHNFMVTFSGDTDTFQAIKERFQLFISDIEKIAMKARSQTTYQLNFDLFKWT